MTGQETFLFPDPLSSRFPYAIAAEASRLSHSPMALAPLRLTCQILVLWNVRSGGPACALYTVPEHPPRWNVFRHSCIRGRGNKHLKSPVQHIRNVDCSV